MIHFKIKINTKGEWYWVLYAANGEPVCWSEGYSSRQGAANSANWVKLNAALAPIS